MGGGGRQGNGRTLISVDGILRKMLGQVMGAGGLSKHGGRGWGQRCGDPAKGL